MTVHQHRWALILAALLPPAVAAWDGHTEDGDPITVESYDHGGRGEGEVEYIDQATGETKRGYLDMHPGGTGELTDYETGETTTVDME